jgi:hypothetical protein
MVLARKSADFSNYYLRLSSIDAECSVINMHLGRLLHRLIKTGESSSVKFDKARHIQVLAKIGAAARRASIVAGRWKI